MNLLFGHDKSVADWASKQSGAPISNWYHAVGIINGKGLLVGCAWFREMNGSNVEVCFWGPGCVRPSIIRGLMKFAFEGLKVNRVTARTPRQNKTVTRHLPAFGFRCEGVAKHYYGPKKRLDAIMFGLLADDARRFLGSHQ